MHDSHELDLPSIKAHVSSLHFIFIHVFTNTCDVTVKVSRYKVYAIDRILYGVRIGSFPKA